jgi:hypothetical protein
MRTSLDSILGIGIRLATVFLAMKSILSFPLLYAAEASDAPLAVEEAHVTDYWTRTKNEGQAPKLFPKAAIRVAASGCVAFAFTIDADGKAQSAKVLNSFISRQDSDEIRAQFEKNVLENVSHWRYVPTAANDKRQSISTYAKVTVVAEMGLHSKTFQEETSAHCKVDNFSAPAASRQPNRTTEHES